MNSHCDSSEFYDDLFSVKFLSWKQRYALEEELKKKNLIQTKNGLKYISKIKKDPSQAFKIDEILGLENDSVIMEEWHEKMQLILWNSMIDQREQIDSMLKVYEFVKDNLYNFAINKVKYEISGLTHHPLK